MAWLVPQFIGVKTQGFKNLVIKSKSELDLTNQVDVQKFLKNLK